MLWCTSKHSEVDANESYSYNPLLLGLYIQLEIYKNYEVN